MKIKSALMGTTRKKLALWAALLAGTAYAVVAHALPWHGPNQELYRVYYVDGTYSQEVGVQAISHGYQCQAWHVSWGVTTRYSRVVVSDCPNLNGDPGI